jgi:hypothetical protein
MSVRMPSAIQWFGVEINGKSASFRSFRTVMRSVMFRQASSLLSNEAEIPRHDSRPLYLNLYVEHRIGIRSPAVILPRMLPGQDLYCGQGSKRINRRRPKMIA